MLRRMAWAAAIATLVALLAASAAAAQSTLLTGQTLGSGQVLSSPDGRYELAMQSDGNLVLSVANPDGAPRPLFSSGTGNHPGATATLEPTGDLVISDAQGVPVWGTNSSAKGCANLDVQDDGNAVLYTRGANVWSTATAQHNLQTGDELLPDQSLYSPGRNYQLTMAPGGRLELKDSAGTIWHSTDAVRNAHAYMAGSGALEVVAPSGRVVWSVPSGSPVSRSWLHLFSDGGMTIDEPTGTAAWRAKTGAARSGLSYVDKRPPFVFCPATTTSSPPVSTPVAPPPAKPHPNPRTPDSSTTGPVKVKLPRVKLSMLIAWRWWRETTEIRFTKISRFPKGATIHVSCQGRHGCPTHRVRRHGRRITEHRTFAADWRHIKRLERELRGQRFRPGDRITIAVSQRHHRTSRTAMMIRSGRKPQARSLS